jgi:hypothetical protein
MVDERGLWSAANFVAAKIVGMFAKRLLKA